MPFIQINYNRVPSIQFGTQNYGIFLQNLDCDVGPGPGIVGGGNFGQVEQTIK